MALTITPTSTSVPIQEGVDVAIIKEGTVNLEGLWSEAVDCSRGRRSARVCEVEGGVLFGKTGRGGFVSLEGTVRNAVAGGYVITAGVLDGKFIDRELRASASVALRRPYTNIALVGGGRFNQNFAIGRTISPALSVIITSQSFLEVFPASGITVTAKCFWRGEKFDILSDFMPEWRDTADCELDGGSAVTDATGVATFERLVVRSANTNLVQLAFFAGGLTTSLTSAKFPYPFSTEVQAVELILRKPLPQSSPLSVAEGEENVLPTYFAARVTGTGGVPLAGRRVRAEISFSDGAPSVSAALFRSTAYDRSRKELVSSESLPSDGQGLAIFPDTFAFSLSGAAGPFRIELNSDGFESASSDVINVLSSVKRLVASWTPRNGTMVVGIPDAVDAVVTVFGDNDLPLAGKSVHVSSVGNVVALNSPSSTSAVTDTQGRVIVRAITVISINATKPATSFQVTFICEGHASAPSPAITLILPSFSPSSASSSPSGAAFPFPSFTCSARFVSAPSICRIGSAGCSGGDLEVLVTGTFGEPLPGVLVRATHSPLVVSPVYFIGPGGSIGEVFSRTDFRGVALLSGITVIAGVDGLLALSAEAYLNNSVSCSAPFKALRFENLVAHIGIRSILKNGRSLFPISGDLVGQPIIADSATGGDRYDLTLSLLMADRVTPVPASSIVPDPAMRVITAPVFVVLPGEFSASFGSFVSATFPVSGLTSAVFNTSASTASYSITLAHGCPPFNILVGSRLMGHPGTALFLTVSSPVHRLELVNPPSYGASAAGVLPGAPFTSQPAIRVLDKDGNPLQGVRLSASAEALSDQAYVANLANATTEDAPVSTTLSRPTGADGIARWSSLGFLGAVPSPSGYIIRFDTVPPSNVTFVRAPSPVPVNALARTELIVSDWGDLVVPSGGLFLRPPRMHAIGINGRVKIFAVVAVVSPFSPFDVVPGFDPFANGAAFSEKLGIIREVRVRGDIVIVRDGSDAVFSDLRITGPPGLYSIQFVGPGLRSSTTLGTASTLTGAGDRYGHIFRLTSDPSAIFFTSTPPAVLALGGTVSIQAKAVTSTGGGIPDLKVTLQVISSPGTVSRRDVVLLDPETSSSVTDPSGVATFQTKFVAGPSGFYTFKVVSQSAESAPSTLMQLLNPVDRVTVLVQPTLGNHSILVDDSERGLYADGEPQSIVNARKRIAENEAKRANTSRAVEDLSAIPVIQPVVLVRGPDGLPVQDVSVEPVITNQGILRFSSTLTNASGMAAFRDLRITAGKSGAGYEIYFVAQGLSSSTGPGDSAKPFFLKNARDPDASDLKNWQLIAFASIAGVMPFWLGITMSRKSSPLFLVLSWAVSAIYVWFAVGFLPGPEVRLDELVFSMRAALIIAAVFLSAFACIHTALTLLPARFFTAGSGLMRAGRVSVAPPALLRKGNDAIAAIRSDHHQRFVKPTGSHLAHLRWLLRGKQAFDKQVAVDPVLGKVREASEKEVARYNRWLSIENEYKAAWLMSHPPMTARLVFWVKSRLYACPMPQGVVANVLDASAPSHFPLRLLFGLSLTVIGLFICSLFAVMAVQFSVYGIRLAQYQLFSQQSSVRSLAPTTQAISELERSVGAMAAAVSSARAVLSNSSSTQAVAVALDSAYADLSSRFEKLTVSDEISISARLAKGNLAAEDIESLLRVTAFIDGALKNLTSDDLVTLLDVLYHDAEVTGYSAIAIALALVLASVVPLAMRYPSISRKLRRGDRTWAREGHIILPEGRLDLAARLPGFMLWGNVFAFTIFFFVVWLLLFALTFNSLRSQIFRAVWPFVLTLLSTSFLGSIILPLIIRFFLTDGRTVVTHPSIFSLADTIMVIISIITGISGNISRFFTTIFAFLVTFNRIDLRQGEIDTGFNIYYSVAEAQHSNNNVVVIVAVDILSAGHAPPREGQEKMSWDGITEKQDDRESRSRRVFQRWCVAYTLIRNPALIKLRKSSLAMTQGTDDVVAFDDKIGLHGF